MKHLIVSITVLMVLCMILPVTIAAADNNKGNLLLVRSGGIYLSTDNGASIKPVAKGKDYLRACWLTKTSFVFLQGNDQATKFGIMNLAGKVTKVFPFKNVVAIGTNPAKGLICFLKLDPAKEDVKVNLVVIYPNGAKVLTQCVEKIDANQNDGGYPWMHFSSDGKMVSYGLRPTDVGPVTKIEPIVNQVEPPIINPETEEYDKGYFLTRDIAWLGDEMYFSAINMEDMKLNGFGLYKFDGLEKLAILERPMQIEPASGGDIYIVEEVYVGDSIKTNLHLYHAKTGRLEKVMDSVASVSYL